MTSSPPPGPDSIWGGSPGEHAPSSPVAAPAADTGGGAPPGASDLLVRRLLRAAGVLSVLLIAVVVNAVLHGDETGSNPLNPVAEAAERTQESPGAHVALQATYSGSYLPAPVTATGSGVFNSQTDRSRLIMVVPNPTLGKIKIESVGEGSISYLRSTAFAGQIPEDKEWIKIDPFLGEGEPQYNTAGGISTKSSLEMLAGSGDVKKVGQEDVRGTPTTRYKATIHFGEIADAVAAEGKGAVALEYEKLAEEMPQGSPVEAWIDGKGIVRRLHQQLTMSSDDGKSLTMDIDEDLFGFGAEPDIAIPNSNEVFDTTPLMREQLEPGEAS